MLLMRRSCWCAYPADTLMHWSCWCTDADDALVLLMYWYYWCADAIMLLNHDQDLLADLSIAICSSIRRNLFHLSVLSSTLRVAPSLSNMDHVMVRVLCLWISCFSFSYKKAPTYLTTYLLSPCIVTHWKCVTKVFSFHPRVGPLNFASSPYGTLWVLKTRGIQIWNVQRLKTSSI